MTQLKPVFIVAVEYLGADVDPRRGPPQQPVREHAYDLRAGNLAAHDDHPPRVGFPDRRRGWTSTPRAPRCQQCNDYVDALVTAVIADHLRTFLARG